MRSASTSMWRGGALLTCAAIAAITLGGCSVHAQPDVGYAEVSAAPLDVTTYPYTYYDGRTVYLVNDHWMYRDRGRWLYYVNEPPVLYQQRPYVRYGPPAYGPSYGSPSYGPSYGSPSYGPSYGSPRYTPAPRYAPPASAPPAYGPGNRTPAQPRVGPPASAPPAARTR